MSKYTRSLPLPIISLLNERRDLVYNKNFPNMVMAGHALCVSKAKRTALACAHSEAQLSKRKAIGFYKDPVFSAEDITYGLLAYYYLQDSRVAIEQFMDAFDVLVDSVPELESANAQANVSEPVSANVSEALSERVSVREREQSVETSSKKKTSKRKSKDKASAKNEREALSKVIARKYESTSTQPNPKISIQRVNKEAHEANDYLRNVKPVAKRSALILDAITDAMMNDSEIQKRGATFDETAEKTEQVVVNHHALNVYMPLTTDERMTLMQVIYQKYVKGTNEQ